jgi:lipopolysaccharide export system permease protein
LIIDRYILRETLYTLIGVLSVLLVIFISNRFVNYLSDTGMSGIEAGMAFRVLALSTTSALMIILPLGLFIAILLAFSRLYKDSEMVALAACGVSIRRVYRSILVLALLVAALVALISFKFSPWAEEQSYRLRDEQRARLLAAAAATPGRFIQLGKSGGVMYFQSLSRDGTMQHIFARQPTRSGTVLLTAQAGDIKTDAEGRQTINLRHGYRYEGEPGTTEFRIIRFSEHVLRVQQPEVTPTFRRQRAIPTAKLWASMKKPDIAELQWRASMPLSVLVLALLAVPISRTNPRQGKYARLFLAVLIYLIYNNLLGIADGWVARGVLSPIIGMWWVHIVMLVGIWLLFVRQYGVRWIFASLFRRTAVP